MKISRHWLWLLFIPVFALGLARLRLDGDVLDLLPSDEPAAHALKLYQEHFANVRELIITVRSPEPERAEAVAKVISERLQRETNLVAKASWQPPWAEHPAQIGEVLAWMRLNQPPELLRETTNRLAPENLKSVLAESRETLATSLSPMDLARRAFDPYDLISLGNTNGLSGTSFENMQGMFSSKEGNFRVIFVDANVDITGYKACSSWLKTVQGIIDELRKKNDWGDATIRYTGRPVFVTEIASGMERDISSSVTGTAIIIAILFWLAHRRWLPLLWLLALLAMILVATLAMGGLILGSVSVLSMGFAAILLGLAVDYALVHYQEALAHPTLSIYTIRRAIAPSIIWAAVTTISAFLVLNLGGLPGLAQLGSLVAIGVALSALVMVFAYLPPLFPDRLKRTNADRQEAIESGPAGPVSKSDFGRPIAITFCLLAVSLVILFIRHPQMDHTGNALRPLHSNAESALEEIQTEVGMPQDPLWVIVSGRNEMEVYERLLVAESFLKQAVSNNVISGFMLPTMLWPQPEYQKANRPAAAWLGQHGALLHDIAIREGFTSDALILSDEMCRTFSRAGATTEVFWPTNSTSEWLLKRFVARSTNDWMVLGLVYPATNAVASAASAQLLEPPSPGIWVSGWQLLGTATLKRVQGRLWLVVTPMVLLVLISLWRAFRHLREVLMGIGVLVLSGFILLAVMSIAGWSWNLLNLMALPLVLGTGVDYSIFMQLALQRHHGDLRMVHRSVGRALLLCGATAVAGFGSLAWSSNAGMASLGRVCAVGIAANVLIAVFLLPKWWGRVQGRNPARRVGCE